MHEVQHLRRHDRVQLIAAGVVVVIHATRNFSP